MLKPSPQKWPRRNRRLVAELFRLVKCFKFLQAMNVLLPLLCQVAELSQRPQECQPGSSKRFLPAPGVHLRFAGRHSDLFFWAGCTFSCSPNTSQRPSAFQDIFCRYQCFKDMEDLSWANQREIHGSGSKANLEIRVLC